jgi:hypothetical protein
MRFIKTCATLSEIVKGRKGYADITNKICLGSNLEEEQGNVSTVCQIPNIRESKTVIRIEKWACFAIYLLIKPKKC